MDFQENESDIIKEFRALINEKNLALPVCAMNVLVSVIRKSTSGTWMQLEHELRSAIKSLKGYSQDGLGGKTNISILSGCDLFMKYLTNSFLEFDDFGECKAELLSRGEKFAGVSHSSRHKIAELGHSFVQDNCTVLIHGNSRVVTALMLQASKSKQFNIVVTEGRPNPDG